MGKTRYRKTALFVGLAVLVILMGGCVELDVEVRMTLHEDGSVDMRQTYVLPEDDYNMLWLIVEGDPFASIREGAEQEGFEVEQISADGKKGIQVSGHLSDPHQIDRSLDAVISGEVDADTHADIQFERGFFKNHLNIDFFIEGPEDPGRDEIIASQMVDLTFVMELPIQADSHNADVVDESGKVLTWNVDPLGDTRLQVESESYNPAGIAVVVGVIMIIAGSAVFFAVRR